MQNLWLLLEKLESSVTAYTACGVQTHVENDYANSV
jgi:hypothetical protein